MPGMSGRFSTVVKAKINKLLDKAEDPGETLDYSYQKQLENLQNVKKGIADIVTAKKRLQMQSSKIEQSVVKLDTQARQALAAGREDLARQALERKSGLQQQLHLALVGVLERLARVLGLVEQLVDLRLDDGGHASAHAGHDGLL